MERVQGISIPHVSYDAASRWLTSPDVVKGDSYLWHEKYSLRLAKVLGFVACHTTSKLCGIGATERCWGGVKQIKIKTGKHSHLSGESTEKRSIYLLMQRLHRDK